MTDFYDCIFKRKSFHLFRGVGKEKITEQELDGIRKAYEGFDSLYPDTKTAIRIVSCDEVNFKNDAQYCVLLYSEMKENALMNAGYIGQQLDLYLVKNNIGSLRFGLGKPDMKEYEGLSFVIMFAIRKVEDASMFRKDMFKAKRKPLEDTWKGETLGIADIARFAPSACNSQPWQVVNENNTLSVFRKKQSGRISIMSEKASFYFNRIDMGIYLCILEQCMMHSGISFQRKLFADEDVKESMPKVAEYTLL